MSRIDSKVVFITTSPRTPTKIIPEIELLDIYFRGKLWNKETQTSFMDILKEEDFFNGSATNDPAFSARDRINRAPKALGFIRLKPVITLTKAGEKLIKSNRKEEVFLRQLLKFQIPSPYHVPSLMAADFKVKPFLELFRLIREFGNITFDEIQLFGLQLVNYERYDEVVSKIKCFRQERTKFVGSYNKFYDHYFYSELVEIYNDEIASGKINTRESNENSINKFLSTKRRNMRDYTDACFRYLRSTGMVNISHLRKSISIVQEKIEDVDYFLKTINREPCYVDSEDSYVDYLGDDMLPSLLTDDRELLELKINTEFPLISMSDYQSIDMLKDLLFDNIKKRKDDILQSEILNIKKYKAYDEIQTVFEQIKSSNMYDAPLMLEWNTWRAMTMLDGGEVNANLKFDDFGQPMSTAQGNLADIVCDYGDFGVCVEVTLSSGQRQYEMEGEPVARHLAKYKKLSNKPAYCLFVAPTINEACVAHFFTLHNLNVSYYGGKSVIVPLTMEVFRKMVEDSYNASYQPQAKQIRRFFEKSNEIASQSSDEIDWYNGITELALDWLNID